MKQLRSLSLIAILAAVLICFSCAVSEKQFFLDTTISPEKAPFAFGEIVQINIAALKGPSGMGMVKLMEDADSGAPKNRSLLFSLAGAPDEIVGRFVSGEADIAAVPVNLASILYNKTDGQAVLLAINTLGVLYVLEDGENILSIEDLAGKTLYATGRGSTPEYLLNHLLKLNGLADKVTVEYKTEHAELAALLASGEVTLGMLPEPNVTAAIMKNPKLRIALDLTEEWKKVSDTALVQGCIIARKDFLERNSDAVDQFLNAYKASADFVNNDPASAGVLIEKYGILSSAAAAEKAIPGSSIVCITGEEMKKAAEPMLEVLFEADPKSIGGKLPENDFYYVP